MTNRTPGRTSLAAVPLAVAYGAVPLGTAAARLVGEGGSVSSTLPWLLLAGLGTLLTMQRPKPGGSWKKGLIFNGSLFLLLIVALITYSGDIIEHTLFALPYLSEASPLVFLLFCGLWAASFGMPDRADFQRFGALLSVLCIVDVVAEVAIYQAVPAIRWLGNADILAGLLLVSLCASLKPGGNEGGGYEPDQGKVWWRLLIMVGVVTCVSRSGLFAAGWIILCFGRAKLMHRMMYFAVTAMVMGYSFLLPTTASDAIRYTDYWLWVESIQLLKQNAAAFHFGFPIADPLPFEFPMGMSAIWERATGASASFGAFLPQIPSFWLRVLLAWGIYMPTALLAALFILLFRRLTRMGAGLVAALFAQGMTSPLLFDPAMAIAIGFGAMLAFSAPVRKPNTRIEEPVAPSAAGEDDPAKEWDLRPL